MPDSSFESWLDKPISGTTRRAYYSDNQLTAARDAWEAATATECEACARVCEEGAGFDGDHPHDVFAAAIRSRGAK